MLAALLDAAYMLRIRFELKALHVWRCVPQQHHG